MSDCTVSLSRPSAGRENAERPLAVPPPYSGAPGPDESLELRSTLDCWACAVLVTAQNVVVSIFNILLIAAVFGTVLMPASVMVIFGFLCHSQVLNSQAAHCKEILNDNSSTALMVVGFVLVTPLAVLALAAYCRLARHLQLSLCFIPYSKAVYRNLPASHYRGAGLCCLRTGKATRKVWV
ncbi:transmembrane protein 88-like [Carcharodon carcharias]|uniref:transmembrane protein 88-like n=1 Tax=Carcharodon carcharias TaxID=13397 RepID=UPI001B7EC08A|nr:transmembrane protein 88-like [Carcharodon carcharias]